MARTCLNYLSSNIFDIELESDEITQNILSGAYRLHWFAASQWIEIVRRCASLLRNQPLPENMIQALDRLVCQCENGNYEDIAEFDSPRNDEFEVFKERGPNIHKLLHQELQFRRMDVGNWRLEDDEGISESDSFYC